MQSSIDGEGQWSLTPAGKRRWKKKRKTSPQTILDQNTQGKQCEQEGQKTKVKGDPYKRDCDGDQPLSIGRNDTSQHQTRFPGKRGQGSQNENKGTRKRLLHTAVTQQ